MDLITGKGEGIYKVVCLLDCGIQTIAMWALIFGLDMMALDTCRVGMKTVVRTLGDACGQHARRNCKGQPHRSQADNQTACYFLSFCP